METYYAKAMPEDRQRFIKGIALLAVLFVLAGGAWWLSKRHAASTEDTGFSYQRFLPQLSAASIAKLPPAFPRQYIYGTNPVVLDSDINFNSANNSASYRITVRSSDLIDSVYADYLDYFNKTLWTITAQEKGDTVASITAERGTNTLIVTFRAESHATITSVNYLTVK